MSNITIVLSKEAMQMLFPEGSEARVQLATSAIKAMIDSGLKPTALGSEVTLLVEKARREAVREVTSSLEITRNWGHDGELRPDFKEKLRAEVRKNIDEEIGKQITAAIESKRESIDAYVLERVRNHASRVVAQAMQKAVEASLGVKV